MNYYWSKSPRNRVKLFLKCLCFVCICQTSSFAQTNEEQIATLLEQRTSLNDQSLNTLDVDRQLFNLGYRPKAEITSTGNSFSFPVFLPVAPEKQAVMESRIKSICPFLVSLQLNPQLQTITAVVTGSVTESMINDIITHFGFVGYEIN